MSEPTLFLRVFAFSLVGFAGLCLADHRFHRKAAAVDPQSGEWLTHSLVVLSATATNLSMGLLWVDRPLALLLFSVFFLMKLLHEIIDEVKWHLPRCGRTESFIHLGMLTLAQIVPLSIFVHFWHFGSKGFAELSGVYWIAIFLGLTGLGIFSAGELQLFWRGRTERKFAA